MLPEYGSGIFIKNEGIMRYLWFAVFYICVSFCLKGQEQLVWGNFRGDRLGIYCFNDNGDNGSVDIDYFHYQ